MKHANWSSKWMGAGVAALLAFGVAPAAWAGIGGPEDIGVQKPPVRVEPKHEWIDASGAGLPTAAATGGAYVGTDQLDSIRARLAALVSVQTQPIVDASLLSKFTVKQAAFLMDALTLDVQRLGESVAEHFDARMDAFDYRGAGRFGRYEVLNAVRGIVTLEVRVALERHIGAVALGISGGEPILARRLYAFLLNWVPFASDAVGQAVARRLDQELGKPKSADMLADAFTVRRGPAGLGR